MSVNEVKLKRATELFVVRGTGNPTSRTFCIGDEDHTIGNALRHILIRNSAVGFAGYSVPHPSEPIVQIRVQTIPSNTSAQRRDERNDDNGGGAITAIDALKQACETLLDQCDIVMEQLEEILPEVRDDRIRMENLTLDENDVIQEEEVEDDSYAM